MIIILHNIRSVYNVGSIFRTADALSDIEKIYLCGITPAPVNGIGKYRNDFSKTALGAEKTIPWEKKKSTLILVHKLRQENKKIKIIAVEQAENSMPYHRYDVKKIQRENLVLIMGGEIKGLSKSILNISDVVLEIPMHGKKESLNVSVAFAIIAFFLKY